MRLQDALPHYAAQEAGNRTYQVCAPRDNTQRLLACLVVFLLIFVAEARAEEPTEVAAEKAPPEYSADVEPILTAKCIHCHGEDVQKAALDLSSPQGIRQGGESGPILDFHEPEEGLLFEYIREGYMPPEDEEQLTEAEILIISRWISRGAHMDGPRELADDGLNQHDVLPILRLRCVTCHGSRTREGGLDVRSKESLLTGGKSGPAVVVGKPEDSLLLKRIHAGEMPPNRQLASASVKPPSAGEIETITRWIAEGLPEEAIEPDVATTETDKLVSDEDRQFWAFQSPRAAVVPVVMHPEQVRTPVDTFLLRRLEAEGLAFSPPADRHTLVRRAYFDLIGLPPTPEEVAAFVSDPATDSYERMIDRLLASPRYGERWGQYWLDLAGYSDSEGVQNADRVRDHAWRYRDYVIRAFNDDKPYDRFLLEQLAGDELADYEHAEKITPEIYDNLVATGFLRMAADGTYAPITAFVPDRLELIDDQIEIFSSALLGLTIKCAKCHTHKFDPIPHRDYYRLAAVFKGAWDEHDWLVPGRELEHPPGERDRYLPYVTDAEREAWEQAGGKPENQPLIRALWDRGEPSPTYILARGNYLAPDKLVGPGVPSVLTDGQTPFAVEPPWPGATSTGRRLALARWMVKEDHPLTARVMVNRVWKHHFDSGIVKTLDNFGKTGTPPTHPELLDWLAVQFVKDGWSVKSLHRLIMNSSVYRQSSQVTAEHLEHDPNNELLSRMPLRRMEGEVLRDTVLALAGQLDLTPFGPPDAVQARGDGLVTSAPRDGKFRRSIYMQKRRTQPLTILSNFDVAQMDPNNIERTESIVAPQALHLTNNQMVYQLAGAFAEQVWQQTGGNTSEQVEAVYRRVASRLPTPAERTASMAALERLTAKWFEADPGTEHIVVAGKHLWLRETEPDRVSEDDLVSVWSSQAGENGRRFGVIEFDLSSLRGMDDIVEVHLELGSTDDHAIRQTAAALPPGIDGLTWRRFHDEKASHLEVLAGLGRYEQPAGTDRIGSYVQSSPASADDLLLLRNRIDAGEKLAIVLMADEDGVGYRRDWDDGVYGQTHNPPRLIVHSSQPNPEAAARRALHTYCHAMFNSATLVYID